MTEYIYIVDNRGPTPKCVKAEIVKRTTKLVFIDRQAEHSGAFDYRSQFAYEDCHYTELDAIRAFKTERQKDVEKLKVKLARAELDVAMCLKTMEALRENSA